MSGMKQSIPGKDVKTMNTQLLRIGLATTMALSILAPTALTSKAMAAPVSQPEQAMREDKVKPKPTPIPRPTPKPGPHDGGNDD